MDQSTSTTKTCTVCKVALPLEAFSKAPGCLNGRRPTCRQCLKAQAEVARAMLPPGQTKACGKCLAALPLDAFCKTVGGLYGRHSICRRCTNLANAVYLATIPIGVRSENKKRWRDANPEHVRETARAYQEANGERLRAAARAKRIADPEYMRRIKARYNAKNADKLRLAAAAYRAENADKLRARAAAWDRANRDLRNEYQATRRARRKHSPRVEKIFRAAIIARDASTCYLCKRVLTPRQVTLDHVIPLKAGGEHTEANLRVACRSCNSRKHALSLAEFLAKGA